MDGFLVLARCFSDDVPVRLFATRAEADAYGKSLTEEDVIRAAPRVLKTDVSIVIAIGVVPFAEGLPGEVDIVKDFEEEEALEGAAS